MPLARRHQSLNDLVDAAEGKLRRRQHLLGVRPKAGASSAAAACGRSVTADPWKRRASSSWAKRPRPLPGPSRPCAPAPPRSPRPSRSRPGPRPGQKPTMSASRAARESSRLPPPPIRPAGGGAGPAAGSPQARDRVVRPGEGDGLAAHSALMTRSASSIRATRTPGGSKGMPAWSYSSLSQPAPRPNSKRPSVSRSTVAASLASRAGAGSRCRRRCSRRGGWSWRRRRHQGRHRGERDVGDVVGDQSTA